jgi:hypothetical protein
MPKHPKHSAKYPEHTRAIFVANVNGSGEDVMVFTTLSAEQLERTYRHTSLTFEEIYEVPEQDIGTHLWEPCWLTLAEEARALELAAL